MGSERWSYQVVEVKPGLFGFKTSIQDRLNQLGLQGWELVTAIQPHRFMPVTLYLRKAMP